MHSTLARHQLKQTQLRLEHSPASRATCHEACIEAAEYKGMAMSSSSPQSSKDPPVQGMATPGPLAQALGTCDTESKTEHPPLHSQRQEYAKQ